MNILTALTKHHHPPNPRPLLHLRTFAAVLRKPLRICCKRAAKQQTKILHKNHDKKRVHAKKKVRVFSIFCLFLPGQVLYQPDVRDPAGHRLFFSSIFGNEDILAGRTGCFHLLFCILDRCALGYDNKALANSEFLSF